MPARSSSPIDDAISQLATLAEDAWKTRRGCWRCWRGSPIHDTGGACGTPADGDLGAGDVRGLAAARSFTATAEWGAGADQDMLRALGVSGAVPSGSRSRRVVQRLDADAFDDLAGQWAQQRTAPGPGMRRAIAVDGKTLGGSGHGDEDSRHMPAAFDPACGVVLGQVGVDTKTSRSRCSPRCWTGPVSAMRSSPPTRCTFSAQPAALSGASRRPPALGGNAGTTAPYGAP